MILRSDHIAGGAFVVFGLLIIALSGDLPFGQLSMPGAGFLPKIVATLTIVFGLALIARGRESPQFSELSWSDGKHAAMVTVITAVAIALYEHLGFMLTMGLMMIVLMIVVERRNPLRAGAYGIAIVLFTYVSFAWGLKTPLPEFSFSF
jgi:hypothetical protein